MSPRTSLPQGGACASGKGGSITPASPPSTNGRQNPEHDRDGDGRDGEEGAAAMSDADEGAANAARRSTTGAAGSGPSSEPEEQRLIPDVSVPRRMPLSMKGLLAVLLLVSSLVAASTAAIQRLTVGFWKTGDDDRPTSRNRPAAAMAEPRKLDLSEAAAFPLSNTAASTASGASTRPGPEAHNGPGAPPAHRIPALVPTEEELAEPIGVRRTGAPAQSGQTSRAILAEDAPVMLVTTKPSMAQPPTGAPRSADPTYNPRSGTHRDSAPGSEQDAPGSGPMDPRAATERNLQEYQRRLQGLLDQLTRTTDLARPPDGTSDGTPAPTSTAGVAASGVVDPTYTRSRPASLFSPPGGAPQGSQAAGALPLSGTLLSGNLLGGQLPSSTAPKAMAALLGNRSLTLPKGTSFTCALKTRIVTASSGLVGCMVQRNVYGDDGRVLLIERGSHLDGEYRVTTVRPGTVRIPVLWTRVRTPFGVTVNIDSPATGQLGESGIEGHVDNRWTERLGAAMLLSLIDDAVQIIASNQAEQSQGGTIVLSSTTSSTSKLAEKVLDSTINIPPLIYRNQGGIVAIHVARDVDFSSVYELVPSPVEPTAR